MTARSNATRPPSPKPTISNIRPRLTGRSSRPRRRPAKPGNTRRPLRRQTGSSRHSTTSAWKQGPGGFGTDAPGHGIIGTPWTDTPGDIWLRRTFNPGPLTPQQISRLVFRDYHDEDIDVYINGVPAYSAPGFISSYEYRPLSQEARQSLKPNADN